MVDGDSAASADPPMKMRHPDQEHPLATEPVAERGAGDEQDREGQGVGVDHPLQVGQARAEVALDDGQGGRHDEVVEGDHEQGERRDREGPQAGGSGPGHRLGSWS